MHIARSAYHLRLVAFVALCVTLFAACEETETESSASSTSAQGTPSADAGPIVATISHEYPGEYAYRSVTYELRGAGEQLRWNDTEVPRALLEAVRAAATKKLLPSDGLKGCRYAKSYPTLRVKFVDMTPPLELLSNARCAHWAPWNVVQDGKLFVQLDGSAGDAVLPLLEAIEPPRWAAFEPLPEGRFELESLVAAPPGVEAQALPVAAIDLALRANPTFKDVFGETEPTNVRLLCSQRRSPDCSTLLVHADVPYARKKDKTSYTVLLEATATLDAITGVHWPSDIRDLDALLRSKLFASFKTSVGEHPIQLHYDAEGECEKVAFGAAHYLPETDASTLSCASWRVSVEYEEARTIPPTIFYYPAISAARLANWADHTDPEFYKRIGARESIMEAVILERVRIYSSLDGALEEIPK